MRVEADLSDAARDALVPAFSLQTLVENAVRHGAAPRVEATEIAVSGRTVDEMVVITEDLIKLLEGLSNGYRRGRQPESREASKVASVLRVVADELET